MENNDQGRRRFLNVLLGVSGVATAGSVFYPLASFLVPPRQAESSHFSVVIDRKFSELKPGDWLIFRFGNKPGLLICDEFDGKKRLKAFSATCTHLNCIVEYLPEEKKIFCPCHNGVFDSNGNNIAGPPPKPLEEFSVLVSDDSVTILRQV